MKIVYAVFRKLVSLILFFPRKFYYAKCRKRLTNTTPTIIASDCFGGIAYHNLGLRFMSPTINLFFSKGDFIAFVQNLEGYLEADLVEISDDSVNYPVGELEYNGRKIKIYFMHYQNFADAKEKWNARKNRVNYSNIYIIQTIVNATKHDIELFDSLPYNNKMLIAQENPVNSKNVVTPLVLKKKGYQPGELLRYKSIFSVKRHMDEIDYVGFLNNRN